MSLAEMIVHGPLYVHVHQGRYRCVWTPMQANVIACHGVGVAETPYAAIARACTDAVAQGWAK